MPVNQARAQQIAAFNNRKASSPPAVPPGQPPAKLTASKGMSATDIALIQKSDSGVTLSQDEVIRYKALQTKENLRVTAEQQAALDKANKDAQLQDAKLQQRVLLETVRGLNSTKIVAAPAVNWFSNLPTPGGLATIIIILIVFVMAIVPVDASGTTRLKLVWLTLTGKTHLRYQEQGKQGGGSLPPLPFQPLADTNQPTTNGIYNAIPPSQLPQNVNFFDLFGGTNL